MSTSVTRRSSATGHPTRQQLDELDALLQRMLDLPVNRNDEEADAAPAPAAETPTASGPEPLRGPHRPTGARPPAEPPAVNYRTAEEEEADLKPRVVSDAPPGPEGKPSGDRPQDWAPLSSAWQPSARTWKPLSEAWKQAQSAAGRPADAPAVEGEPALAAEPSPEPHAENDTPAPETAAASAPEEAAAPAPPTETPRILADPSAGPRWLLWPLLGFNAAFDACLIPFGPAGRWLRGRAGRMILGAVGLLALAAALALMLADWFGWTV